VRVVVGDRIGGEMLLLAGRRQQAAASPGGTTPAGRGFATSSANTRSFGAGHDSRSRVRIEARGKLRRDLADTPNPVPLICCLAAWRCRSGFLAMDRILQEAFFACSSHVSRWGQGLAHGFFGGFQGSERSGATGSKQTKLKAAPNQ